MSAAAEQSKHIDFTIGMTGGKDSRLVLAAAVASGER